ncbi:MAG: cytochrome P450 [Lentinula lateritia]|uniref:Cytochrome P450 n=1 Tax=Lentinula lateritia TaxID=40482 RepID=A0ABQ8VHZ4_9AGAR|nr:MAG: cytochrome P450 [Lentinula lateritia]KAJ4493388.1 cytochrome P450 [Lentinula lateritia]
MRSATNIVASVLASIVSYYLLRTVCRFLLRVSSSLPNGPSNADWLFGNQKEIWSGSTGLGEPNPLDNWHEIYGRTFTAGGFFGTQRIYSKDIKAIQHIMRNDQLYLKPPVMRNILKSILGEGTSIIVAEREEHKIQRKVMNPAFGPNEIRELTSTFFEKSIEMRDIWNSRITAEGFGKIDSVYWLSKVTVDIIGLTGFNYHFNALNDPDQTNELNRAFTTMFRSSGGWTSPWMPLLAALPQTVQQFIRAFVSVLGYDTAIKSSAECIQRQCRELMMESKAFLAATGEKDNGWSTKNLLSLILKSNMSSNTPMSDVDAIAQIPTFLIAGHDTTSLATNWALLELALHQDIQSKLGEEILSVRTAMPNVDELNALPYLDAFVRETMRLHSPITTLNRVATQDDIIPLTYAFTDRNGIVHNELPVRKGQLIHLTLHQVHTDKSLWGPHADEFRPDRWLNVPNGVQAIPGVWSNLLTFWGGTHGCMGWRFSVTEMKVFLFVLLRSFHFELGVPKDELTVLKMASIWQRPSLKSAPMKTELPLIIRPFKV